MIGTPSYERYVAVARVVLEAATALSLTRGTEGRGFDTELLTDANNLPAIPGSAIAGVLRHLYGETYLDDTVDRVFGFIQGQQQQASRMEVSWGAVHDAFDRPIDELLLGDAWSDRLPIAQCSDSQAEYSALLRALAAEPVVRDHVKLDARGVALLDDGRGMKFDRAILPAGCRFTFELVLRSHQDNDPAWDRLLGLLKHPAFRVGGGTRRGLGRLQTVSVHSRVFDLGDVNDRRAYLGLPRALGECGELSVVQLPDLVSTRWEPLKIQWRPMQPWRMGGEDRSHDKALRDVDLRPLREAVVVWSEDSVPRVQYRWVLPASGLKGALAHRMVFHANRLEERWAVVADVEKTPYDTGNCPAVMELFGFVAQSTQEPAVDDGRKAMTEAQVGRLLTDDVLELAPNAAAALPYQTAAHTSLDRWTGGVRRGALFDEAFLPRLAEPVPFSWWVRKDLSEPTRRVFQCALNDWLAGALNIGAAGSRGFGYGEGTLQERPASWDDVGGQSL